MQPSYVSPGSPPHRERRPANPADDGTSRPARSRGDAGAGGPITVRGGALPGRHSPAEEQASGVLPPTGNR
ncbi:hypothetical protein [Streptomyces sp. NPDC020983]|uniref:hypothetical protein n=1 Tax=Streptomyces sp. NPDC020983 TaxID=3365106 RepID=UPI0037AF862B